MTLQVTNQASAQLKELLDVTEHDEGQVVRVIPDQQGKASFVLDVEKEGDLVIDHQGETVMVIEPEVSEGLTGVTLDVEETPQGVAFTLRSNE